MPASLDIINVIRQLDFSTPVLGEATVIDSDGGSYEGS